MEYRDNTVHNEWQAWYRFRDANPVAMDLYSFLVIGDPMAPGDAHHTLASAFFRAGWLAGRAARDAAQEEIEDAHAEAEAEEVEDSADFPVSGIALLAFCARWEAHAAHSCTSAYLTVIEALRELLEAQGANHFREWLARAEPGDVAHASVTPAAPLPDTPLDQGPEVEGIDSDGELKEWRWTDSTGGLWLIPGHTPPPVSTEILRLVNEVRTLRAALFGAIYYNDRICRPSEAELERLRHLAAPQAGSTSK